MVVVVDGHRHQVRTHAITVGDALRRAGFDLHPEDLVSPSLETLLQSDTVVQVQRAQPVTLGADGQIRQFRTQATTIGSFLAQEGVALSPADEIWLNDRQVGPDTSLSHGLGTAGGENPDAPMIALRRAASLTLNDGGEATTLHTTLTTVGQVLQEHGVILFLGDEVSPGFQERIVPGMAVTIHRSVPVQIEADGRVIRTRTRADTVAGVLGQEGIALVGKDRVEPDLGDTLQADSTIRVTRVREEYVVEFDPIPFEMIWVPDPEVEIDNIRLVQDGQVGLTKRRYRVTFEDELEVSRTLEDIWAEQPPITKTMAYGTKIVVRTTDSPDGPIEYWRKMRVYLVSYKPSSCGKPPDHPRYGYTRLGWFLEKGIVAVDPDVIPLRTNLYVPGYGLARAGDTGGGVRGKMVDLGFSDDDYESWHWWADIYVLTPVPQRDKIRWVLPNWPKYPDRRR
jgi:uncharacterized protein YabE (DUF348 family)/3D (Asp-Asp-Asp) domain-containing protein